MFHRFLFLIVLNTHTHTQHIANPHVSKLAVSVARYGRYAG